MPNRPSAPLDAEPALSAAQTSLRTSEALFRSVAESGLLAVLFFDSAGVVTAANDAFLEMVGYTREELAAGHVRWDRITPPEWLARAREAVQDYEETGRVEPYEKEYVRKDGTRFWALVAGRRVDGTGEGVAFVLDISDRKRAELELRASQSLQSFLLELSDALRPLDDAREIQRTASRVLCERLGAGRVIYTEERAPGELEAVASVGQPGMPDQMGRHYHLADFGPALHSEFLAGRTTWRDDVTTDARHTDAERTAYAALRVGAWANVPLVKGGRLVAMLSAHFPQAHAWTHDELLLLEETAERTWAAAERARAEAEREAVRQAYAGQARFIEAAMSSIPDFVYAFDRDHRFVYVNRAMQALFGRETTVIGRTFADLGYPAELAGRLDRHLDTVLATGRTVEDEVFYTSPTGVSAYFDFVWGPVRDAEGRVELVVGVSRDTTERHRLEQDLRESEAKYRAIFDSINEGFSLLDIQFDAQGNACDAIVRDANPAQGRIDGLRDLVGRGVRVAMPGVDVEWIERCAQIVRTGEAQRFEEWFEPNQRWYEVHATRVGGPGSTLVAIAYGDITARKAAEADQAMLSEITKELVGLTRVADAMDRLGERVARHFRVKWCVVVQVSEDLQASSVTHGWHDPTVRSLKGVYRIRDFLSPAQVGRYVKGELFIVGDTRSDPRVNAQTFTALGVRSFVIIPLVRDGQWRFQISIADDEPREWRDDEVALLREVAERIWTRLERARAEEALRENEARQREEVERLVDERTAERDMLRRQLAQAEEAERRRIARELHDQLGQDLTVLNLRLASLMNDPRSAALRPELDALQQLVHRADGDLDVLVWQLRPTMLDDLGLVEALRDFTSSWARDAGVTLRFHADGINGERLPPEIETVTYRVAQESLNNVAKHANATAVEMVLARNASGITLTVHDDGRGFDLGAPRRATSLGLAGMRERAALVGGTLEVRTHPGDGTSVQLRIPLPGDGA